jgi:hypothetical protein
LVSEPMRMNRESVVSSLLQLSGSLMSLFISLSSYVIQRSAWKGNSANFAVTEF